MVRGKRDLDLAKAGYKDAENRGDRDEQARWANQVGHACKERGQYVEALKWFRKDYEISTRRMDVDASPPGNLMPTCQSMGEIYLRLQDFEQALIYQRKHFELAEETDNLEEQQRASTQLGRTYLEIYEQKDDFTALRHAKEYLQISMDLARALKENPPSRDSPTFVKEIIDSYNNMGLLMMIVDDPNQATELFQQGLNICDEEELRADDDARSRIHHNLGRLYCERREWDKAKHHTQTDIAICQKIPHPQGEAKGFVNLGEMYFKCQKYEEATRCFERALQVAQSLEDEDSLVSTAQKNLEVVSQAQVQMQKLMAGVQQLKRLQRRRMNETIIRVSHRTEEYKLLNELIGLSEELQAWEKHLEFAKNLKSLAKSMGDMEKLGDSLETVGQSYYNLRIYSKAKKWNMKSWDLCSRIGHLEGQCVAKINYGNTLDCIGDREEALKAYNDAYDIARSQGETRMLSQQISALENMHYCYFVRLERMTNAMTVHSTIKRLKELRDEQGNCSAVDEHCSETENESDDSLIPSKSDTEIPGSWQQTPNLNKCCEDNGLNDDDAPLASVLPPRCQIYEANNIRHKLLEKKRLKIRQLPQNDLESQDYSHSKASLKRPRIVLWNDDEVHDSHDITDSKMESHMIKEGSSFGLPAADLKVQSVSNSFLTTKEPADTVLAHDRMVFATVQETEVRAAPEQVQSEVVAGEPGKVPEYVSVEIGGQIIQVNLMKQNMDHLTSKTVNWLKEETVLIYSCNNPSGLKPLLRDLVLKGKILQSEEKLGSILNNLHPWDILEATVDCWVPMLLVERYQLFCELYHQKINTNLLEKLKNNMAVDDRVSASGCNLDDWSGVPLMMALNGNGFFSHIDFSHNSLGNQSMQKILEMIATINQPDLGLILDLHNNKLGAASVGHICECPITLSRLEVLNLSGNRLTDAAARYLAALLRKSQALEVLKLENCNLTSRTILKISSALQTDCPLVKIAIGRNNPISSLAIVMLFEKLSSLNSFSELDLTGVCLDKPGVEGVDLVLKSSKSFSNLFLGETSIRDEGVLELTSIITRHPRMINKLDISFCGFTGDAAEIFCSKIHLLRSLTYLNISGNKIGEKGAIQLASALLMPECRLKTLLLRGSHLGWSGILTIMKALQGNNTLQQLILCGNNLLPDVKTWCLKAGYLSNSCHANDSSTTSDHAFDQATPKPSCCSAGGNSKLQYEHYDGLPSQTEQRKVCVLETQKENCCYNPVFDHAPLPVVSKLRQDDIEAISSSEFGKKTQEVSVIADSEDDSEAEQSSNKHSEKNCLSLSKHIDSIRQLKESNVDATGMSSFTAIDCNMDLLIDEVAAALNLIEGLHFLDLSDNGLNLNGIQKLSLAWQARARWATQLDRHVDDTIVHFTADNMNCCGSNPCCEID